MPRQVTGSTAEVFVGAFGWNEPPPRLNLSIRHGPNRMEDRVIEAWEPIAGGRAAPIFCWTAALSGLTPGTRYDLSLDGPEPTRAWFETLPTALPRSRYGAGPARPFTVWVSSCFHAPRAHPQLEELIERVTEDPALRPHIKLLLGDQVYLDFPQWRTFFLMGRGAIRAKLNRTYGLSWTHPAMARLLAAGATFTLSDDHEFWDDFPERPGPLSWRSRKHWKIWSDEALLRYRRLQGGARTRQLAVGNDLRLFLADTRIDRSEGNLRFMSDASMAELETWIKNLPCPGVIALGQPVLRTPGGASNALSDYRQYWRRFLPALRSTPQDLVVLAGDEHFGRVAQTVLNSNNGARLIEIVSSPLALVSQLVAHQAPRKPKTFHAPGGQKPSPVTYERSVPTYREGEREPRTEEQGMTLAFHKEDGAIVLQVTPWMVRHPRRPMPWRWETRLRAS
jgi:hypothetical protein